jgi:hypothetical protein
MRLGKKYGASCFNVAVPCEGEQPFRGQAWVNVGLCVDFRTLTPAPVFPTLVCAEAKLFQPQLDNRSAQA